jgi:hypothetical protein
MHSPNEPRSKSPHLSGQTSHEFRDFRTTLVTSDERDHSLRATPGIDEAPFVWYEPFSVTGVDQRAPPTSAWTRLQQTCGRSIFRFEQNNALSTRWFCGYKLWSKKSFGRRPRLSRTCLAVVIAYLSIVSVPCWYIYLVDANGSSSGAIHVVYDILSVLEETFPEYRGRTTYSWRQPDELSGAFPGALSHWPTDATRDVHPVNCHSHNDYWRSIPLHDAIYAGCTGAEADIWLIDDELYVGHRRSALTANRTLHTLYLDPLMDLLEKQNPVVKYHPDKDDSIHMSEALSLNGVFDVDPDQTFILLVDFKTSGPLLWLKLNYELTSLREKGYLSYFNSTAVVRRPITIVATGNAPFELLTKNETYRDIFFDAPLDTLADTSSIWPNPNKEQDPVRGLQAVKYSKPGDPETRISTRTEPEEPGHLHPASPNQDLGQGKPGTTESSFYDTTNSYYASVSFTHSIGRVWGSRLTQAQLQLIRSQIRGAHQRGLKVR